MKGGRHNTIGLLALFLVLQTTSDAAAIPPPDFVVNAGVQIAQAVGVAAFFCSAAFAYVFHRFKAFFHSPWRRRAGWSILILGVAVVAVAVTMSL